MPDRWRTIIVDDRFQRFLDTVETLIVALDLRGRVTAINKCGGRILGWSEAELVGQSWFETCLPQPVGRDVVYPRFLDMIAGAMPPSDHSENPVLTRNGDVRQIAWHNVLLRDHDGRITGTLSFGDDVTERERAAAALRASEDRFKWVFEHSNVGKSITQVSGLVSVNRAFCDLLGYGAEELDHVTWQSISHPDDIESTQRVVEAILSGAQDSARFTKRYLHKNGSVVWADVSSTLRRDESGAPLYFMTTIVDVTERIRAADTLSDQLDELRRWHEATIGRERRVLELKREVNGLLVALGQPPRYASVLDGGGP